jgi:hypothetical protein
MAVKITCIKKQGGYHEDPHHAIESVRWIDPASGESGSNTRIEMYDWIKLKNGEAYVSDGVRVAYVGARLSPSGTKYIQTYADGRWSNNLLALPECS